MRLRLKLVLFNIVGLLAAVGSITVLPIFGYQLYRLLATEPVNDERGQLGNYSMFEWNRLHFEEWNQLRTHYRDFIIWRRQPFEGETININEQGLRFTQQSKEIDSNDPHYYLFGGSTMWGTGASDEFTIPSLLSERYNIGTTNYGESGYIARQSLAMLINEYALGRIDKNLPNTIIFYDGCNDVVLRCRSEVSELSTDRESQIHKILSKTQDDAALRNIFSWRRVLEPGIEFANRVRREIQPISQSNMFYACAEKEGRAIEVAQTLLETWYTAATIASDNGDRFVAILQPSAFIGSPNVSHLLPTLADEELMKQFKAVYPLIKKFGIASDFRFIDFSSAYDTEQQFYIDYCHVSPQGNSRIIDLIGKHENVFGL